ncbi:MAG: hypothetical protein HY746_04565 [Elusimicrobia bacterium]|nr:hypothetical protein [Elusimicrobiota bacterium]
MTKKIASILAILSLVWNNPAVMFAVENAFIKSVRVSAESVYISADKPVKYKACFHRVQSSENSR